MILLYPNKNKSFAPISTLKRDKWLYVKTPQLPKTVGVQLKQFYEAIASKPLDDETATMVCAFDKVTQAYIKTYAPAVYATEDGLAAVCWGNELFPLTNDLVNLLDVEVRIEELEQYKETCLVFVLEIGDDYVELPLQLRIDKEFSKEPLGTFKKIVKAAKSGKGSINDLAAYLYVRTIKEGSGGGDFPETHALKDLEPGLDYYLVSYEYKDFGSHQNYILETVTEDNDTFFVYAPKVIFNAIQFGAIIKLLPENGELIGVSSFSFVIDDSGKKPKYVVVPENIEWPDDDELVKF